MHKVRNCIGHRKQRTIVSSGPLSKQRIYSAYPTHFQAYWFDSNRLNFILIFVYSFFFLPGFLRIKHLTIFVYFQPSSFRSKFRPKFFTRHRSATDAYNTTCAHRKKMSLKIVRSSCARFRFYLMNSLNYMRNLIQRTAKFW